MLIADEFSFNSIPEMAFIIRFICFIICIIILIFLIKNVYNVYLFLHSDKKHEQIQLNMHFDSRQRFI